MKKMIISSQTTTTSAARDARRSVNRLSNEIAKLSSVQEKFETMLMDGADDEVKMEYVTMASTFVSTELSVAIDKYITTVYSSKF